MTVQTSKHYLPCSDCAIVEITYAIQAIQPEVRLALSKRDTKDRRNRGCDHTFEV